MKDEEENEYYEDSDLTTDKTVEKEVISDDTEEVPYSDYDEYDYEEYSDETIEQETTVETNEEDVDLEETEEVKKFDHTDFKPIEYKKPEKIDIVARRRKNIFISICAVVFIILFFIGSYYLREYKNKVELERNKEQEKSKFENEFKSLGKIYIINSVANDDNEDTYVYTSNNKELDFNDRLLAEYNCQNEKCSAYDIKDKYVLIYDKQYYLYDYKSVSRKELNIESYFDTSKIVMTLDNDIKGILLNNTTEGNSAFYNYKLDKVMIRTADNNIKYNDLSLSLNYIFVGCSLYSITQGNEVNKFEQIVDEEIESEQADTCILSIEGTKDNYYYTQYLSDSNPYRYIYNKNYEVLFNKTAYSDISINNTMLLVNNKTYFTMYEKEQLINSDSYDKVLDILDKYVIVVQNNTIKLVDYSDNVIASYVDWNNNYVYNSNLTGYYKDNNKDILYIVINNKKTSSQIELYYNPSTGSSGKNETNKLEMYLGESSIYMYPLEQTNVSLSFKNTNFIKTFTPKYNNQWETITKPSGEILVNGSKYKKLYYEESMSNKVDFSEGFYVTKDASEEFINDKLKLIGFNNNEIKQFKLMYLDIFENNKRSVVYFELTDSREKYNKFNITPEPDTLIRVCVHIKKVNEYVYVKKQSLENTSREGFTVTELGLVQYK